MWEHDWQLEIKCQNQFFNDVVSLETLKFQCNSDSIKTDWKTPVVFCVAFSAYAVRVQFSHN